MPPRYAYWTILVDDQATAFRAGAQEDLMPTFKRLKAKHPSAKMMWFQNGKLWDSRIDAQEAMRARGEMGRRGDDRQLVARSFSGGGGFRSRDRAPFKPPAFAKATAGRQGPSPKPQWSHKSSGSKLEWRPKGEGTPGSRFPDPGSREKRKWVPKEEYKKSLGIEARRDSKWRPGGEHKDPRQKYKDAKKAKWSRFKQTIRKRWEGKPAKKNEK